MTDKAPSCALRQPTTAAQRVRSEDEAGLILFVDSDAAARYLALNAQTLKAHRILGSGPIHHKFGKLVRYAVRDLDAWATSCRREPTSEAARVVPSPSPSRRRWPVPDILRRARFVNDAGPVRFVDTEAAAEYLALEAHTLECYRSLDGGPTYHKFGKYVRYAVDDLDAWVATCRRVTATSPTDPSRRAPLAMLTRHSLKAI